MIFFQAENGQNWYLLTFGLYLYVAALCAPNGHSLHTAEEGEVTSTVAGDEL